MLNTDVQVSNTTGVDSSSNTTGKIKKLCDAILQKRSYWMRVNW